MRIIERHCVVIEVKFDGLRSDSYGSFRSGCVSTIVGPGTASPVSGVARFQSNRRGVTANGIGVVADLAVGRGGGRY